MITVSVWGVLGFIALGMLIAEVYEFHAWCKYTQGKRECETKSPTRKQGDGLR